MGRKLTTIIAFFIAGGSTTAFLVLWFVTSYRELSSKKREVDVAAEQVRIHYNGNMQESDNSNAKIAKKMLDTSRMIYSETVRGYNDVLFNPINCFPGFIMGFREMSETDNISYLSNEN